MTKLIAKSLLVSAVAAVALTACQTGFSLPPGNLDRGREAFVKFQCADCHAVVGHDELRQGMTPVMTLPLGGKTDVLQTYAELVTSIINPSHVISPRFPGSDISSGGRSRMPNYNYAMSVNELIDLVTFLQAQYELKPYEPTIYETYDYQSGM